MTEKRSSIDILQKNISIIIPFRDNVDFLRNCIGSIFRAKTKSIREILLVDNQSKERSTQEYLVEVEKRYREVRVLSYDSPFNFSAINNFAVEESEGELILFLNNDTKVISNDWLVKMAQHFDDPHVGAVGAKLLYPNNTIQHAGIEVRNHDFANVYRKEKNTEDSRAAFNFTKEYDAVTAACMMTRKSLFKELRGFDEDNLKIAYNDVDYCFEVRKAGYKVLYEPKSVLYHYESVSRGKDFLKRFFKRERYKEFLKERDYIKKKWDL